MGLLWSLGLGQRSAHKSAHISDTQSKHFFHIGTDIWSKYRIGASLIFSITLLISMILSFNFQSQKLVDDYCTNFRILCKIETLDKPIDSSSMTPDQWFEIGKIIEVRFLFFFEGAREGFFSFLLFLQFSINAPPEGAEGL